MLGMLAQAFLPPSTTGHDALMDAITKAGGMTLERLAGVRQLLFSLAYAVGLPGEPRPAYQPGTRMMTG